MDSTVSDNIKSAESQPDSHSSTQPSHEEAEPLNAGSSAPAVSSSKTLSSASSAHAASKIKQLPSCIAACFSFIFHCLRHFSLFVHISCPHSYFTWWVVFLCIIFSFAWTAFVYLIYMLQRFTSSCMWLVYFFLMTGFILSIFTWTCFAYYRSWYKKRVIYFAGREEVQRGRQRRMLIDDGLLLRNKSWKSFADLVEENEKAEKYREKKRKRREKYRKKKKIAAAAAAANAGFGSSETDGGDEEEKDGADEDGESKYDENMLSGRATPEMQTFLDETAQEEKDAAEGEGDGEDWEENDYGEDENENGEGAEEEYGEEEGEEDGVDDSMIDDTEEQSPIKKKLAQIDEKNPSLQEDTDAHKDDKKWLTPNSAPPTQANSAFRKLPPKPPKRLATSSSSVSQRSNTSTASSVANSPSSSNLSPTYFGNFQETTLPSSGSNLSLPGENTLSFLEVPPAPSLCKRVLRHPRSIRYAWTAVYIFYHILGALAITLLAGAFGVVVFLEVNTLPVNTAVLTASQLTAKASINRDANGVIHIEAVDLYDLTFTQGVAMMQNRIWQAEFQRKLAGGRLSELIGSNSDVQKVDQLMRTFGFAQVAAQNYAQLQNKTQQWLQAFCDGINFYLASNPPLSIEFYLLRIAGPDPWTPTDVILWQKMMSLTLSLNMEYELQRLEWLVNQNLTAARIDQLIPPYQYQRFPTILQGNNTFPAPMNDTITAQLADLFAAPTVDWLRRQGLLASSPLSGFASSKQPQLPRTSALYSLIRTWMGPSRASNNWVIGPSRVDRNSTFPPGPTPPGPQPPQPTPHAILANDPHLQITAPNIWLLMHLHCLVPPINAIGASLVGVPGIIIGHNSQIAWGLTNSGADIMDLYMMEEQKGNTTHYFYQGQWLPYKTRNEIIHIKGADDMQLPVRQSVYGPVISDVLSALDKFNGGGEHFADLPSIPLSLRWTSLDSNDTTLDAIYQFQTAKNWNDFTSAMAYFVSPPQNFVFSDHSDDIGYVLGGRIPMRQATHSGVYPVPGNGSFDWIGWMNEQQRPNMINPDSAYIASANNALHTSCDIYVQWQLQLQNQTQISSNSSQSNPVSATAPLPTFLPTKPPIAQTAQYCSFPIARDWDGGAFGYRVQRIIDFIVSLPVHNFNTMTALQNDDFSLLAQDFLPVVQNLSPQTAAGQLWQTRLSAWNGTEEIGSVESTVFQRWMQSISELPSMEINDTFHMDPAYLYNVFALKRADINCDAFQYGDTLVGCLAFASMAFDYAANSVSNMNIEWGVDVHQLSIQHQVLGSTVLGCLANRDLQHGGDSACVNVGSFTLGKGNSDDQPIFRSQYISPTSDASDLPFTAYSSMNQRSGASYRQLISLLGTLDQTPDPSRFIIPMGQSGALLSDWYDSLNDIYAQGHYLPMNCKMYYIEDQVILQPSD